MRLSDATLPDPFTGLPEAPIIIFTLNSGYTDDLKAERWRKKGCTGSDDWWHKNSVVMRECYKANLKHESQEYPLFFLDPRLRGSPGGVYYRQQLGSLIHRYSECRVAKSVCIVEYFPYHSKSFANLVRVPSQEYSLQLIRSAILRRACIVVLRKMSELLRAVPELNGYSVITPNSARSATVSPGNLKQFEDLCRRIEATPSIV